MVDRRKFKGTSVFLVFKTLIENELNDIENYIKEIAGDLQLKQEVLERRYDEANKEVDEDNDFDVHMYFEDDIHKYFRIFPVYTYNPLLLTIYGQFELWLKKLCDLDSNKGLSKVKVVDLAGHNYIEKSRKYLEIVANVNIDDNSSEWKRITEIQKIRNCIAHNASSIKKGNIAQIKNHELFSVLANDKRIEFDEYSGDFYIKDKAYLLEVIELIKKYLFEVIEKLRTRKVIARNITMPFNNENWGEEETEGLLESIINTLSLLDEFEKRTDEFKKEDLKQNLLGQFTTMTFSITKLYAFFLNGEWKPEDTDLILREKSEGLKKLKAIYQ